MEGGVTLLPSVIFDLDGTLIDSIPDLHAAVGRMLAAEGLAPMSRAEVQSYVGDGAPELVRRVMQARGMDPARHEALTAALTSDYSARAAEATKTYPHVHETLQRLGALGHPLGICTNKPASATAAVLAALDLDVFFGSVIAGDTLPERKPHPAPLLAARDALKRTEAIYVGDSEVDAETAAAAALPFVLFTKGYLRAPRSSISVRAEFSDFRVLPAVLSDPAATR